MALNNDLVALVSLIKQTDAYLVTADGFVTKYPRLFSQTAKQSITSARADLKAVTDELTAGADLVLQLTNAVKGV